MTPIRELRRQHAHAIKMRRLTRMKGWDRAVTRLCRAIMEREAARIGRSPSRPEAA